MSPNLARQLALLPTYLGPHMVLTVVPLAAAAALTLPLAILAVRRRRLRRAVLAVAGIIQTIPGLALLALMVPVLAVAAGPASRLGLELPALGFLPAALALTLYGMLPMLRNTVTGIVEVDTDLVEAARGLGMTPGQVLRRVELPLAAPVILAGVRTAAVWTVGMATLATPVGQTCLGNYIFSGLQTRNWTAVLVGCAAAALLALLLDGLLAALEAASRKRSPLMAAAAALGLLAVVAAGLAAPGFATRRAAALHGINLESAPGGVVADEVVIGAKTFTEQYILAALMETRLQSAGLPVRRLESLGSTIIFDALAHGDVDVYVDYSGTIWANHMGRQAEAPGGRGNRDEVLAEVTRWLDDTHGILCLGSLGFENAYAMAMSRTLAAKLGVASIADLGGQSPALRAGGDYEFFGRPEWRDLRTAYGLEQMTTTSYDPAFMYRAATLGQVDTIAAFSSDGRIEAHDLVVLSDPQGVIPPYDAILLLSPATRHRPEVVEPLRLLVDAITVQDIRHASLMVDGEGEGRTVQQAARWLEGRIAWPQEVNR